MGFSLALRDEAADLALKSVLLVQDRCNPNFTTAYCWLVEMVNLAKYRIGLSTSMPLRARF